MARAKAGREDLTLASVLNDIRVALAAARDLAGASQVSQASVRPASNLIAALASLSATACDA
jgi:hypothetical protein